MAKKRAVPIRENTIKLMLEVKNIIKDMDAIIDEIMEGSDTVYNICEKHGTTVPTFYRQLKYLTMKREGSEKSAEKFKARKDLVDTYPMNLYKDVFFDIPVEKVGSIVPDDYEDRIEQVKNELNPQLRQILDMRYKKNMSLREIGENTGISHELARTRCKEIVRIMQKACNKEILQSPLVKSEKHE